MILVPLLSLLDEDERDVKKVVRRGGCLLIFHPSQSSILSSHLLLLQHLCLFYSSLQIISYPHLIILSHAPQPFALSPSLRVVFDG